MNEDPKIKRLEDENQQLREQLGRERTQREVCRECSGLGYISIFPERWSGDCGVCNGSGKRP